ncbi:hypothetical protein [Nonomuraea salmonea]|uniref:hypothetical protein n=1 Tax=Nonomuraea salmonea TaxID=46181 RepID=UPI002FE8C62D
MQQSEVQGPQAQHLITDLLVEINGDQAAASSYSLVLYYRDGQTPHFVGAERNADGDRWSWRGGFRDRRVISWPPQHLQSPVAIGMICLPSWWPTAIYAGSAPHSARRLEGLSRIGGQPLLTFGTGSLFGLAPVVRQLAAPLSLLESGPQEAVVAALIATRLFDVPSQGFAVGITGLTQLLFPAVVEFGGALADARPYAWRRCVFGGGAGGLLGRRVAAPHIPNLLLQACVILLELAEFVFRVRYAGRVSWAAGVQWYRVHGGSGGRAR